MRTLPAPRARRQPAGPRAIPVWRSRSRFPTLRAMANLNVETRSVGNLSVLKLDGTVDATVSPRMEQALTDLLTGGAKNVVVELSGVKFMSSAGWGVLLGRVQQVRSKGGSLVVAGMASEVNHVYGLLGLKPILKSFATEGEAVAALR